MKLSDIAQVIRSKNAGPRRLTLDIMFGSDADYQRVAQSPALGAENIGRLYRVPPDTVTIIPYPVGRAIKIVSHSECDSASSSRSIFQLLHDVLSLLASFNSRHHHSARSEIEDPRQWCEIQIGYTRQRHDTASAA